LTLPALTKVPGYVIADQGATLTLPALTESGYVIAYQGATLTLPALTKVPGYVIAYQGATLTLPALYSIKDMIRIESNSELEKQLWKKFSKNEWTLNEFSSEWLCKKRGNFKYYLNNVNFTREWFMKIRFDQLKASEVFAIDNIEHRRIAYQFMDKTKMKELEDFEVLDRVENDGYGYPMQIVSFTVQNMSEKLKFMNVFCPSTGREYYIGTNATTCGAAKAASFGLTEDEAEFVNEW
jgi:hypothetical protein